MCESISSFFTFVGPRKNAIQKTKDTQVYQIVYSHRAISLFHTSSLSVTVSKPCRYSYNLTMQHGLSRQLFPFTLKHVIVISRINFHHNKVFVMDFWTLHLSCRSVMDLWALSNLWTNQTRDLFRFLAEQVFQGRTFTMQSATVTSKTHHPK